MSPEDEAKTLFTVESNDSFIHDPHNARFRFSEELSIPKDEFFIRSSAPSIRELCSPRAPRIRTYLRFTVDNIGDQTSFVFGSKRESCDIYVKTPSQQLFAVDLVNNGRRAMLKNLSPQGIAISSPIYEPFEFRGTRVLHPYDKTAVLLETFDIVLHFHPRKTHEFLHEPGLQQLGPRIAQAVPAFNQLNLQSIPETSIRFRGSNPYHAYTEIGRGAFGTVYEGVNVLTAASVAIKIFRKSKPPPLKEATILQGLSHPSIVRFIDFIAPGSGCCMLVMELVCHPNMEAAHETRPLMMVETREVISELLQALAYLHSVHVTHRDIKPSNILLVSYEPMSIKMTDFGLAAGRSDQLLTHCGSLAYLAPEVHKGPSYNNKVDLWSVGVLMVWLVLGLPNYPHHNGHWPDILRESLKKPTLDPLFSRFTESLLRSRADDRPAAQESLEDPFFGLDWYLQTQSFSPEIRSDLDDAAWQTQMFAPLSTNSQPLQQTVDTPTELDLAPSEYRGAYASCSSPPEVRHRSQNAPSPSPLEFAVEQTELGTILHDNSLAQSLLQLQALEEVAEDEAAQEVTILHDKSLAQSLLQLQALEEVAEDEAAQQEAEEATLSVMRVPARAAKPARAAMTYWKLRYAGHKVMYKPDDDLVNITQLLRANGYTKTLRWGAVEKKVGRLPRTSGKSTGTLVSMTVVHKILEHFRLGTDSLRELTRQINEHKR